MPQWRLRGTSTNDRAGCGLANDHFESGSRVVRLFHRRLLDFLLAAYLAGTVYLSLLPFDWTLEPLGRQDRGMIAGLTAARFNAPDILANIGYYLPIGLFGYAAARGRGMRRGLSSLAVLAGAICLSVIIERQQRFLTSRVASWVDVTSNVAGAALGLAMAASAEGIVRRTAARARAGIGRHWWASVSTAFVCAVVVIQLRPYDIVTDPARTALRLAYADLRPTARWEQLRTRVEREVAAGRRTGGNELRRAQWEYAADRATDVAVYAVVAALFVLGQAHAARGAVLRPALFSVFVASAAAALVTGIRALLQSRGLDTAHLFCGVAGGLIGGALGMQFLIAARRTRIHAEDAATMGAPRIWRAAALGFILIAAVFYDLLPFDFGSSSPARSAASGRVILSPFAGYFQTRPPDVVLNVSTDLLRYGLLAGALSMLLARRGWAWRARAASAVALTVAWAAASEVMHLWMASRYADVTGVLLAVGGSLFAVVFVQWAVDLRGSFAATQADDELTRRLIEGPGFDKRELAALAERSRRGKAPAR